MGTSTYSDLVADSLTVTTLTVTGTSTIPAVLSTLQDFAVATDKFTVAAASGNTVVAGTLAVTGASTLTGNVTASGTLAVTGASTLTGNTTVGGTFGVTGATTLSSTLAAGNTTITGTLSTSGAATLASLVCTAAATIGGGYGSTGCTIATTGNIQTNGTLTVDGASTLTGAVAVTGNFAVNTTSFTVVAASGNTAVAGTLAVTGASTLTGAVTCAGAVDVAGAFTVATNKLAVAAATGIITCAGGATIDNTTATLLNLTETNVRVTGAFDVTGNSTLASLDVGGGAGGSGATITAAGIVTADGLANLNGGIAVATDKFTVASASGDTVIAGTLGVTGLSTLDGGATNPALKLNGAGSKSAAAYAAAGTAWADGGTPALCADQMYARIYVGATVYRIPLWADA